MVTILKKYAFLLLFVSFSSCVLFEDEDKRTYYKAEGVGYVYNWYTKEPVENAIVYVSNSFESRNFGTVQPVHESFIADKNGYFRVKFLKRTHKSNVVVYNITAHDAKNKLSLLQGFIPYSPDEIKSLDTLKLDTLWLK